MLDGYKMAVKQEKSVFIKKNERLLFKIFETENPWKANNFNKNLLGQKKTSPNFVPFQIDKSV